MRRVNVHLDEELDAELAREAELAGMSKAALIRTAARDFLDRRRSEQPGDAWAALTGAITAPMPDQQHDDDVVYR